MFFMKFKPAVHKRWLFLIAGLLWSSVGVMLLGLAGEWLLAADPLPRFLHFLAGILLVLLSYRAIFSRIAVKNIERISEYMDKGCLFAFQPWKSYFLIVFMVLLGFALRHSSMPRIYLAVIYLAVGGGLLAASFRYYLHLMRIILFVFIFAAGCVHRSSLPLLTKSSGYSKPIYIKNALFFSGDPEKKMERGVNILIKDGVISRINNDAIDVPDVEIIDAGGKTVVPGLIDMHTHATGSSAPPGTIVLPDVDRNLSAFLFAGITTIYDMGSPLKKIEALSRSISQDDTAGPSVYYAGKMLTRKGGHPAALIREMAIWPFSSWIISSMVFEIDGVNEIPGMIKENKSHGAHFIKAVIDSIPLEAPTLDYEQIKTIVKTARENNMEIIAHIGTESDILAALDAGVTIFNHAPYRSSLSDATVEKMKKAKSVVMPTLAVFDNVSRILQKKLTFSQMDRESVDPYILAAYNDLSPDRIEPSIRAWAQNASRFSETRFQNVIKMKKAGITLIAATDTTNVGSFPGSAMHRELELFVTRCGFTPLEALAAATFVPGTLHRRITGLERIGFLAEGMPADMLILNGDFRDNIRHSADIYKIILKGREVFRIRPEN